METEKFETGGSQVLNGLLTMVRISAVLFRAEKTIVELLLEVVYNFRTDFPEDYCSI